MLDEDVEDVVFLCEAPGDGLIDWGKGSRSRVGVPLTPALAVLGVILAIAGRAPDTAQV